VVGDGYGTGQARERVLVVDESHTSRMRRALWRHVAHTGSHARYAAGLGLALAAYTLFVLREDHGSLRGHLSVTVLTVAPVTLVAWGLLLLWTRSRLGRWVAREAVPGRLLAVRVGPETLRVRDHDASVEVSYAAVEGVDEHGDVVVVQHPTAVWALPAELFDPLDLGVLRARVASGRRRRG
jgi:hypothetical protein